LPTPASQHASEDYLQAGRRRSSSEPRPPPSVMFQDDALRREVTATPQHLLPLYEEGAQPSPAPGNGPSRKAPPPSQGPGAMRRGLTRQSSAFHMKRHHNDPNQNMMGHNVVDVLDVIGWYPPAYFVA
jgi:hypothetical protein